MLPNTKTRTKYLHRRSLLCSLLLLAAGHCGAEEYAILIGVSQYDNLPIERQLRGPENDIAAVRQTLLQHGFKQENIRVLTSRQAKQNAPTRDRIIGTFSDIAELARPGDFVYTHFSGHGSRQPISSDAGRSQEEDGLDEIFLPQDVGFWDGRIGAVDRAIRDDEIGVSIDRIRSKGAFVWAVFDVCHAATITRGFGDSQIVSRAVDPVADLGVPKRLLVTSEYKRKSLSRRSARLTNGGDATDGMAGYAAFFASQANETTPEMRLPKGQADAKYYGVFTYTLLQSLADTPAATYDEIAQSILQRYVASNRISPVPVFEGTSIGAPVFGAQRSLKTHRWPVEKLEGGALRLAAGTVQGVTVGSIFALRVSDAIENPTAYARVDAVGPFHSSLSATSFEHPAFHRLDAAAADNLPQRVFGELIRKAIDTSVRVALPDLRHADPKQTASITQLLSDVRKDLKRESSIKWVEETAPADLRFTLRSGQLNLSLSVDGDLLADNSRLHTYNLASDLHQLRARLGSELKSAATSKRLFKIAAAYPVTQELASVNVIARKPESDFEYPLALNERLPFVSGTQITITIENTQSDSVDVGVFFVDSKFQLQRVFPRDEGESSQLKSGRQITLNAEVDAAVTAGTEYLIFIEQIESPLLPDADFSFLGDVDESHSIEAPELAIVTGNTSISIYSWVTVSGD